MQGTVTESTATKPVTVSADKVAVQSANNNSQSNSAELPQTGNNNNEILAFIVLALASALSFLGIGKRQHN
ncbi:LPXTG cell wall anchor domain-containing protein [Limosilactobacillus pontis]|uniref:LPXTG cell wall anchor domain-containing protein n=1 Tax=Limosilactobacillus pontis TaxID=35787 RepID=UPI00338DB930